MRAKLLHQVISEILSGTTYTVEFETSTDNGDGTYTLTGICDFHHLQTGFTVTIGGYDYTVSSFNADSGTMILSGNQTIIPTSFTLYKPKFFHGTPIQQHNELPEQMTDKVPMVYLIEPYDIKTSGDPLSNIASTVNCTLCFLTEADHDNSSTDDLYSSAVIPMKNLMEDVLNAFEQSNKFYTVEQSESIVYHSKFKITVREPGTKKLFFSDNLSGVTAEIRLEVYDENICGCDSVTYIARDAGEFLQIS